MRKNILFVLVALLIMFSCLRLENPNVEVGEPAIVRVSFHPDNMTIVQSKGMTEEQERCIRNFCVFVFFPNGDLISRTELEEVRDEAVVDAYSFTGVGMNIYAVANYDMTLRNDLLKVEDMDDLNNLIFSPVSYTSSSIESPSYLTMLGCARDCIIRTGTNAIDMSMEYVLAKVTVNIIDNTSAQCFNITGWDVVDIPVRSYLVPREDDSTCVDIGNDDDFRSTDEHTFEMVTIDDNGRNVYSESFYLPENERGGRVSTSTVTRMFNDLWEGYRGKTIFAPDKATYLDIKFNSRNQPSEMSDIFGIEKDGQTYLCNARIYLGANEIDDYNIKRGHHYIWNIIFNDNWDITEAVSVSDSNVSGFNSSITVTTTSSLNFDAHPDARVLSIKADRSMVSNLSVEVLDADGRHFYDDGFSAGWLKISPFDRLNTQVSQNPPYNVWQQDAPVSGAEGYFVRGKYIPDIARRLWLTNSEAMTATYCDEIGIIHTYTISPSCPVPGMKSPGIYTPPMGVSIGSAEYPDNDNALIWSKATHRMCYKLTNILDQTKAGAESVKIYIFNDEFPWDGNRNNLSISREAKVKVSYDNLQSGTAVKANITYLIRQLPPLYLGGILDYASSKAGSHDLLIEQLEEYSSVSDPNRPITSQCIKAMQWGYYGKNLYDSNADDRLLNGWFLTANAVYGDVSISDASHESDKYFWSGTDYREKYGSGYFFKPTVANNYGLIQEPSVDFVPSGKYGNSGAPYYYPNDEGLSASEYSAFHPIFNTSAARYCHEKNLDIDGDGNIMPWETLWYLPSQSEVYQAFVGFEAIQSASSPYSTGYYWSSSESSAGYAYYLGFSSGYFERDINTKLMSDGEHRNGSVRCVRRSLFKGDNVFYIFDGKPLLDFSSFHDAIVTTQSKGSATGVSGDDYSHANRIVSKNAATVFVNLRVAMHDAHLRQEDESTPVKMSWRQAVGYPETFPGEPGSKTTMTEPDSRLGVRSFDLSGLSPDAYCTMGLPASENTGCNAYFEEPDKRDKGLWRLPNMRELMLMFIYQNDINSVADDMRARLYWSASQRPVKNLISTFDINAGADSWAIGFGTGGRDGDDESGRTITLPGGFDEGCYVRCVREVYTSIKYKLIYNPNGGIGGPGTVHCYGDTPVIVAGEDGMRHPDGKVFLGWSSNPSSLSPEYLPGSSMTMGHQTKYLYAVWR